MNTTVNERRIKALQTLKELYKELCENGLRKGLCYVLWSASCDDDISELEYEYIIRRLKAKARCIDIDNDYIWHTDDHESRYRWIKMEISLLR